MVLGRRGCRRRHPVHLHHPGPADRNLQLHSPGHRGLGLLRHQQCRHRGGAKPDCDRCRSHEWHFGSNHALARFGGQWEHHELQVQRQPWLPRGLDLRLQRTSLHQHLQRREQLYLHHRHHQRRLHCQRHLRAQQLSGDRIGRCERRAGCDDAFPRDGLLRQQHQFYLQREYRLPRRFHLRLQRASLHQYVQRGEQLHLHHRHH